MSRKSSRKGTKSSVGSGSSRTRTPDRVNGSRDDCVYYEAVVRAGASADSIVVRANDLRIHVKKKPERGAANRAVVRLVAKKFGVDSARVKIVRGLRSKRKLIKVQKGTAANGSQ